MFKNRYWREYPWFMQMVLLGLMMFTLVSFSMVLAYFLAPALTGATVAEVTTFGEGSPLHIKDGFFFVQALSSIGIFLVPAILFAYLAHPKPGQYLGMQNKGKAIHWVIVPIVMLGAIPLLLGVEGIFRQIDFGAGMREMQDKNDRVMKALLTMNSFSEFVKAIAVLAILPAFSEELLFRGVLMRSINTRTRNTAVAIAISGVVFALAHSNPVGLFAIFFAGVLLGYIYYLTGSLWLSILAHFLNNGIQVVLMYIGTKNATIGAFMEGDSIPLYFPLAGAVVFAGAFYMLWKTRTPLPEDWSDDFKGEQKQKNAWDFERNDNGEESN